MKKCKKIKKIIHKKIDGIITPQEEKLLSDHINICDDCKRDFIIYSKIKENLKNMKYEEIPSWFNIKLHNKLINERTVIVQQEIIKKLLFNGFYKYAFVFGLFIILLSGIFYYFRKPYKQTSDIMFYSSMPQLISNYEVKEEIPVGKESYLRVKITSKKELQDVKVQIVLPKEITGDEDVKVVNWKGNLNAGENYIVLKVKSVKEGEYPLEITLKKNSKEKRFIKNVKITKI